MLHQGLLSQFVKFNSRCILTVHSQIYVDKIECKGECIITAGSSLATLLIRPALALIMEMLNQIHVSIRSIE